MFTRSWTAALALGPLLLGCTGGDAPRDWDGEGTLPATAGKSGRGSTAAPVRPGAEILRELGCGACHPGVPGPQTARERAPELGPDGREYDLSFLVAYLQDPGRVRPDIGRSRMPDFHLSEGESLALALYLIRARGADPSGAEANLRTLRDRHPEADAARGRAIFRALNCAGCHRGTGVEPWRNGPDLSREEARAQGGWLRDWLAAPGAIRPFGYRPGTGSRMPDFRLTDAEADTVARLLLGSAGTGGGEGGERSPGGEPSSEAAPGDAATDPPEFEPSSLSPYREAKAEALLHHRLSCLGCHRLAGRGGRVGPALDAVEERRPADYVWGMLRDPEAHVPGTVMPPSPIREDRRRLVASYLLQGREEDDRGGTRTGEGGAGAYLSLVDHPIRPPEAPGRRPGAGSPDGGALYRSRCASCHGAAGNGNGYNARYLPVQPTVHSSAELLSRRTDATLFDGIHAGGRILNRSQFMPAFGGALNDGQIWSLVDHIRELCDCRGPEWSRDGREDTGNGGSGG